MEKISKLLKTSIRKNIYFYTKIEELIQIVSMYGSM